MVINMNEARLTTIEQLVSFLAGSLSVEFSPHGDDSERYAHISRVLKRFGYPQCSKADRGVIRQYLERTSGYSRAQITRLVARWKLNRLAETPLNKKYVKPTVPFARKYTSDDVKLLAQMDQAHDDICGPAIAHLFKRAFTVYQDQRYARLAELSVAHLYNLRKSIGYQRLRVHHTKTNPVCNPIGVRRAPRPLGRVGFLRIDTVHQGDLDGIKGVYHITCVDEVSQWQVQACVQGISETYLLPVLEQIIKQFPFAIVGFHSDNGSEFINYKVATLLDRLHIKQTKSRSRHSNDNALAESKNASVVRKHMGYSHIPQHFAAPINEFYQEFFNPWLNLHRPCMFATEKITPKGKIIKTYPHKNVQTPLERLTQLSQSQEPPKFKTKVTLAILQAQALIQTDLEAASAMRKAKAELFVQFNIKPKAGVIELQPYETKSGRQRASGGLAGA
jgi:transposase InsO family protein